MHQVADVEVAKNIMDANKRLADKNLKNLDDKNIFCVDFVGAIGSGKTTLVEEIIDNTRNMVMDMLKRNIRPEFLNRIDDIIMFMPLSESEITQIVKLQLKNSD